MRGRIGARHRGVSRNKDRLACLAVVPLFGAAVAGCAGPRVEGRAGPFPEGGQVVRLTASNYRFAPNVIEAVAGARIRFEVENASGTRHNLTVRDAAGRVVGSVDIAANKKGLLELPALAPGRYGLACDRPFHTPLGMDGELTVR